jgi:uncharacterized protein YuzE
MCESMNIKYFEDTDTALFEFSERLISETKEISESVCVDLDAEGNLVNMTFEHAIEKANIRNFAFENMLKKSA